MEQLSSLLFLPWRSRTRPGDGENSRSRVLSDPASPVLDIFFIHGLAGHPTRTWTHRNGTFWPQVLLPPNSRSIVLGYDLEFRIGRSINPRYIIRDCARDMLDQIEGIRSPLNVPIMFIAQDFGGLILKEVLHLAIQGTDRSRVGRSIMIDTVGIIFIDTPHYGMRFAKRLRSTLWTLSQPGLASTQVLKALSPGSDVLQELVDRFRQVLRMNNIPIYSCHSIKTDGFFDMNVEPREVVLLFASEKVVPLIGSHKSITKMSGPGDPNLRTILGIIDRTRDRVSRPRRKSKTRESARSAISQSPSPTKPRSLDREELPKRIDPPLFPTEIAVILPAGKSRIIPVDVDMINPSNMITANALREYDLHHYWFPRDLGEITTLRLEYRHCYRERDPSSMQTEEFHIDHTNSLRAPVLLAFDHLRGSFSVPRKRDGLDSAAGRARVDAPQTEEAQESNSHVQSGQLLARGADSESQDAPRAKTSRLATPLSFPPGDQSATPTSNTADKDSTATLAMPQAAQTSRIGDILTLPRGVGPAAASGLTTGEITSIVTALISGLAAGGSLGSAFNGGRSANIAQETLDMAKEKREEEKREKGKHASDTINSGTTNAAGATTAPVIINRGPASGAPGPSRYSLGASPKTPSSPNAHVGTAKASRSKATGRTVSDSSNRLEWLNRTAPTPRHDPFAATIPRANRSRDSSASSKPPDTVIGPHSGSKFTNNSSDLPNEEDDGPSFEETVDSIRLHRVEQPGNRTFPPLTGVAQPKQDRGLTGLDSQHAAQQGAGIGDPSSNIVEARHFHGSHMEDDSKHDVDNAPVPREVASENKQHSKTAIEVADLSPTVPMVAPDAGNRTNETVVNSGDDVEDEPSEDICVHKGTSGDAHGPLPRESQESLEAPNQPAATDGGGEQAILGSTRVPIDEYYAVAESLPDGSSESHPNTDAGTEIPSSQDALAVDPDSGSRGEDREGRTEFPSQCRKTSVAGEEAVSADTPTRKPSSERLPEPLVATEDETEMEPKHEGDSATGAGKENDQGCPAELGEGNNATIPVGEAAPVDTESLDYVTASEGSPTFSAVVDEELAVGLQSVDDQFAIEDGLLNTAMTVEQISPDYDKSESDGKQEALGQLGLGELELAQVTNVGRLSVIHPEGEKEDTPSNE